MENRKITRYTSREEATVLYSITEPCTQTDVQTQELPPMQPIQLTTNLGYDPVTATFTVYDSQLQFREASILRPQELGQVVSELESAELPKLSPKELFKRTFIHEYRRKVSQKNTQKVKALNHISTRATSLTQKLSSTEFYRIGEAATKLKEKYLLRL